MMGTPLRLPKPIRLLAGAVFAAVLAVGVGPAEAATVGGKGFATLARGTAEEARAAFAGQTVIMERPDDTRFSHRERVVPIKGRFVAYFAPDGRLLAWSADSGKVISAVWGVGAGQNLSDGPERKSGPLLCMSFDGKTDHLPCMVIRYLDDRVFDAATGNIFNLKAGAAAPGTLPRRPGKLSGISAAIGKGK